MDDRVMVKTDKMAYSLGFPIHGFHAGKYPRAYLSDGGDKRNDDRTCFYLGSEVVGH